MEDKVDILRKVIIEKEPHSWVAKEYRKSPASISKLLQQFKRHPELLREGLNKQQDARELRATVIDFVADLNEKDAFIRSVQDIVQLLLDEKHIQVKSSLVQSVLREDLGMRYRKVREVAPQENSVRNRILRHVWASKFIEMSQKKTRLINIDETWLNQHDFRKMKW